MTDKRTNKIIKIHTEDFSIKLLYDLFIDYLQQGNDGWKLMRKKDWPYGAVLRVPNRKDGEYGYAGIMFHSIVGNGQTHAYSIDSNCSYGKWATQASTIKKHIAKQIMRIDASKNTYFISDNCVQPYQIKDNTAKQNRYSFDFGDAAITLLNAAAKDSTEILVGTDEVISGTVHQGTYIAIDGVNYIVTENSSVKNVNGKYTLSLKLNKPLSQEQKKGIVVQVPAKEYKTQTTINHQAIPVGQACRLREAEIFYKNADVIWFNMFKQYEENFDWNELMENTRNNPSPTRIGYAYDNQPYPSFDENPPVYPGEGCPAIGSSPNYLNEKKVVVTPAYNPDPPIQSKFFNLSFPKHNKSVQYKKGDIILAETFSEPNDDTHAIVSYLNAIKVCKDEHIGTSKIDESKWESSGGYALQVEYKITPPTDDDSRQQFIGRILDAKGTSIGNENSSTHISINKNSIAMVPNYDGQKLSWELWICQKNFEYGFYPAHEPTENNKWESIKDNFIQVTQEMMADPGTPIPEKTETITNPKFPNEYVYVYMSKTKHNACLAINHRGWWDFASVGFFEPFDSKYEYAFPALAMSSNSGVRPDVQLVAYGGIPYPYHKFYFDYTQDNRSFGHAMIGQAASWWAGDASFLDEHACSQIQAMLPNGKWKSFFNYGIRSEWYYMYRPVYLWDKGFKDPELLPADANKYFITTTMHQDKNGIFTPLPYESELSIFDWNLDNIDNKVALHNTEKYSLMPFFIGERTTSNKSQNMLGTLPAAYMVPRPVTRYGLYRNPNNAKDLFLIMPNCFENRRWNHIHNFTYLLKREWTEEQLQDEYDRLDELSRSMNMALYLGENTAFEVYKPAGGSK